MVFCGNGVMKKTIILAVAIVLTCVFVLTGQAIDIPVAPHLTVSTNETTVAISWNVVPDATGYTLFYAPYPDANYIGSVKVGTQTSFSCELSEGFSFYVAVQAYNSAGNSGYSNIEHFTIWPLSANIDKMPEVYTAAVSQAVIDQYKQLLSPLPTEAKKWITGMGWGLEDLILDSNEIALLECLSSKNPSTILSILTKPTIIDGLTLSELTWARGYQVESLSEVLKDDIDELEKRKLLSPEGLVGIQALISMAATDFEIAKGLHLIGNFGHPNVDIFSYSVPSYNTQLYLLGQLVELGIPVGYEVAAVAAALDYGTLWSIADNDLRLVIAQYAHDIIAYQNQTDVIMKPYNIPKQAKQLPLEAQIGLVWGAPGNYYALTEEEGATKQYMFWKGYREIFSTRPMSVSDFEFLFTEIGTLIEMRKYILANGLFKLNAEAFSCEISKFWYRDNLIYNYTPAIIEVEGRMIYNSYICNMDWQWNRFKNKGKFTGGSGDAYIHTFLLKSLNYSAITITYLVHISGHFDPLDNSWKADTYELSLADYQKIDSRLGWNRVPYDNFLSNPIVGHELGRIRFLVPLQASVVWSNGVPKGYIFRADVSSEPYPPI